MIAMAVEEKVEYKPGNKIAFGIGATSDNITYQAFTFLVFTFYYAVVGIDVNMVTIGFILWSLWNAFNDPILGFLSDKTKTRWGRRIPYIMVSFIPLSLMMIFLWTPPVGDATLSFIYFLLAIMTFDTLYTMNSLNLTALFPEMWLEEKERTSANNIRQIFTVVALLIAFLIPTFLISDMAPDTLDPLVQAQIMSEYQFAGVILTVICIIGYLIVLKWGVRERDEFSDDSQSIPNYNEAFKHTLSNRTFHKFLITNICTWYVFGIIPTIIPLYGEYVLGITDPLMLGIMLAMAFISGGIFLNFWKYVAERWDYKKGWMASMSFWAIILIVTIMISDQTLALIAFFIMGIGLAGSLLYRDLVIADIIDEDEVQTGVRREGAYFGANALVMRLAVIFVFISIASVFNNVGWTVFDPLPGAETLFGLRLLLGVFPAIAMLIGVLAISRYPLVGDRLREMKEKRNQIHSEKVSKT
jgi:GPH family glycoside/pentoside/hexuronide:cation symporter